MTIHYVLDDWQKEALEHDGNLLLCTGRQCGKTFIMSRKIAKRMLKQPNCRIIVCSLTEDQAKLIIVMVLDYLERNNMQSLKKGNKYINQNKVTLKNGSQVIARPVGNTGDAVRGFTGDVLVLDEASRFNELIFSAAKPVLLTTGGDIWMCSTPFGKQGYFYESYLNKHGRFKVIKTNSWDVVHKRKISLGWTEQKRELAIALLEAEKKDMSDFQWRQEYLGEFVDDLMQFFPDTLIQQAQILKRPIPRNPNGLYFMGVDIARLGEDKTTYEIIEKRGDVFNHRESIVRKKQLTTKTHDDIIDLNQMWNLKKIGIDEGSGSLVVGILDFLIRSSIARRIVALNNRQRDIDKYGEKKASLLGEDMYQIMKMMMERGELKLLDDDDVRLSLKSVQYEYVTTPGKKSVIRIFGKDTHIAEGLKRAAYLAHQKNIKAFIDYI